MGLPSTGGYTKKVTVGDGNFITRGTVWDFKASVRNPTENHTLQILMCYLMGLCSKHATEFEKLKNLGFF